MGAGTEPSASPPADHTRCDHDIDPEGRLTCIHQRIHYTATPDTTDGHDELDQIQIDHFLNTLAEIALSVARRKEQLDQ